ncbi:MAG: hypothetical protein ACJAT5_000029 [Lentimonas sp.]|jgi:hypothetical protein
MKKLIQSSLIASVLFVGSAADAFTLNFGATSVFTNSERTGASATAEFAFTDHADGVQIDLTFQNTTGATTFGDGATSATLTGIAFDFYTPNSGVTGFVGGSSLDTLIEGVDAQPFDTLDIGIADNTNFNGGNANGGLATGGTDFASFILEGTGLSASALETAFFTGFDDGSLDFSARFQQVEGDSGYSGSGSDKLLGGTITGGPTPAPVPEPSTYAMFGAASLMLGFVSYRSRNRKS